MQPPGCAETLLQDLRDLAGNARGPAELSAMLYENLRKHGDGPAAGQILKGIQFLAVSGEAAGARLLGAMLEVAAPARRLLPLVRNMSSSRRLWLGRLRDDPAPNRILADWSSRLGELDNLCEKEHEDGEGPLPTPRAGWEAPWGSMRRRLAALTEFAMAGGTLADRDRDLLLGLLGLEVDAWQERISFLAGSIDPFRVAAITRVLPILSRADADIRDVRHMMDLVRQKNDREAFTQSRLRAFDILENREFATLKRVLGREGDLKPLAELFDIQQTSPLPVPLLAHGAARIQAVAMLMQKHGLRTAPVDLVGACRLAIACHVRGEVALPVSPQALPVLEEALRKARLGPRTASGPESWSLDGVEILAGQIVIVLPESEDDCPAWPNFLPTPADGDPLRAGPVVPAKAETGTEGEPEEDDPADGGAAAMKNLVLTNIQSTSLVLGFLRNPKFVAIPGLVEAVATRTRNPRVIEVIAVDRTLHTGFANRGVPLACLRSPVNVSVKILRKFIHVKYISKVDLKRMAQDRAGMRKEVIREIEKYLEALA